jgi:hypothetical protein
MALPTCLPPPTPHARRLGSERLLCSPPSSCVMPVCCACCCCVCCWLCCCLCGSGKKVQKVKRYAQVGYETMWELAIWVFVRLPYVNEISNVTSAIEATGFSIAKELTGKQLGNKGAVGVSLVWGDTPLCFVNSHLAARATKVCGAVGTVRALCDHCVDTLCV